MINHRIKHQVWTSILFFLSGLFSIPFITAQAPVTGPNFLVIFSDDLNTKIGPYMDVEGHTPNLDRLVAEGVRFSRAYCQYPLCGPSRASIMSGLYPETNGELTNDNMPGSYRKNNPKLSDHPSMAGFFKERGYFTARVSKIFHMGVPGGIERGEPGGDEPDSWDYTYNVMAPETLSPGKLELLSPKNHHYGSNFARLVVDDELAETQADYMAASQAIAILESRAADAAEPGTNKQKLKKNSPFFLAVGFVRPHVPFVAPKNCFEHYAEEEMILPEVSVGDNVPEPALRRQNDRIWGMDEWQKKQTIAAYLASVRFMDQQVGRLLDALDRLDLRRETIVVFLSDHGYNLGEHDCWSKTSLWEGSVRVPMIISAPDSDFKSRYGNVCEDIVELIDLYPTLGELGGLQGELPEILQGESLVPYLKVDGEVNREKDYAYTISYRGAASSLRTDQWRYTVWAGDEGEEMEELYDHQSDPEELVNVADRAEYREILDSLRGRLASIKNSSRSGSSPED